jgi:hypothetical protein
MTSSGTPKIEITCVVSTKDRYFSTLPSTLMAIAQQTYKPKKIILLDDSDDWKPVGETDPLYKTILGYLFIQGIEWVHEPGCRRGQVYNHIKSLEMSDSEWIYRVDDDEIPEIDVLEKLILNIKDDVGAIAGLVLPQIVCPRPTVVSNNIEDIYMGFNLQWYLHPKDTKPYEVDHLYSSFLYRKSIAAYNTGLSPVCHREETILTYEMNLKGYKNIIDPSARTWHFRNPNGGIRSHKDPDYFSQDERVFSSKLVDWGIKANDFSYVVLDNGIGDHYMFKTILPDYLKKNKGKKHIFFVWYPEIFEGIPDVTIASIAEAKILFGKSLDPYNVYQWMWDNGWDKHVIEAFRKIYSLDEGRSTNRVIGKGSGKTIVVCPYSNNSQHAKSYPYWNRLIPMLKSLDYKIIQIGKKEEIPLAGVDEVYLGYSFKKVKALIKNCRLWISVDNFLPHFCNTLENPIPGIVIFGLSDPELFGYSYNKNILKSRQFLRLYQFKHWFEELPNPEAFNTPEDIFTAVKDF